jgi:antitoxin component of RelBE/YafQ-DinJ toxin-antitoxin module
VEEVKEKTKKKSEPWSEYVLVKVDKETKEKANAIARARGLTLSALLRIYLIELTKGQ